MAEDIYLQMQKLANQTQLKLQEMSDTTTAKTFNFNKKEAAKQRKFNSEEAVISRDWQKMMSDTSHRREVKDLKKAGLNPVLSVNQGAASYTTSSATGAAASGEAENPASAVGQLMSTQMSSMAGVKQSEISAAATRHAAATTAAAQRAAAAQAAAAQKYAADMHYRTQLEKNKADYMREEMKAKYAYKTAIDKPVTSIGGFLDKLATKSNLYDLLGSKTISNLKKSASDFLNNPGKFFINQAKGSIISAYNFILSANGKKYADYGLIQMGCKPSDYTRRLYIQGVVFQKEASMNSLLNIVKSSRERATRGTGKRVERMYW